MAPGQHPQQNAYFKFTRPYIFLSGGHALEPDSATLSATTQRLLRLKRDKRGKATFTVVLDATSAGRRKLMSPSPPDQRSTSLGLPFTASGSLIAL